MVMAQIWILILCLYITGSAQAVDLSEASFVSAKPEGPVDPVIIFLGAALGVCVVVISAETIIIFKRRNSDHSSEKKQQGASAENTTNQTAESLNYAPIHFKENKPKPLRVKREQPEDIVYSQMMALHRIGLIIFYLYKIYSAQAVRNSEPLVVSAAPGETVTLNCPPVGDSDAEVRMWYKQRLEHAPLEVGSKFKTRDSIISAQFDKSRFKIERTAQNVSLSIERVTKGDEGMYFCAAAGEKTMNFSTATFLAVTDDHHGQSVLMVVMGVALGLSVMWNIWSWRRGSCSGRTSQFVNHNYSEELQVQDSDSEEFDFTALRFSEKMKRRALKEKVFTRVIAVAFQMMVQAAIIILLLYKIYSVPAVRNSEPVVISAEPGKEVTITCTFVDDSSADVRIWYKQRLEHVPLEVGSKLTDKDPVMSPRFKQTRFKIDRIANGISLRIEHVTKEDEGMYFCGLDRQNGMDFSTSTFLAVTASPVDPTVFYLGAALGICVIVICGQAIRNCSGRDCDSVVENKASQDSAAVELSYAAKRLRMKSGRSGHSVYSEVRYFSVTDPNNH
ncbi:hypothetical protein SRHO_G00125080 [Serrasalmus rhombeus]